MILDTFGVQKLFRTLHSQDTVAIGATVMASIRGGLIDSHQHFLVDQELSVVPDTCPEEDFKAQIDQEKKF